MMKRFILTVDLSKNDILFFSFLIKLKIFTIPLIKLQFLFGKSRLLALYPLVLIKEKLMNCLFLTLSAEQFYDIISGIACRINETKKLKY